MCPEGLVTDPLRHGGGAHLTTRLDVHLDCDAHPTYGFRRAANAILFLDTLHEGPLELWNADMSACVAQIYPTRGRLAVFEVTGDAYHGVPQEARSPRRSLATYWWDPTQTPHERPRAKFVARPGDPPDPEKDRWREERSQ